MWPFSLDFNIQKARCQFCKIYVVTVLIILHKIGMYNICNLTLTIAWNQQIVIVCELLSLHFQT